MKLSFSIIILITFILISCFQKKVEKKRNISKIIFETGGCYGKCPYTAVEIDSSLTFKFYGGEYSDVKGYFKGIVSEEIWDSLNLKLEGINFTQLDSSYEKSIDDLATEMIVYYGKQRKHVRGQSASLPDSVMTFYNWLMNLHKRVRLKPITEKEISLETSIQIQSLAPPPLIQDDVKFIPPEIQ
jgi:hypothetical protein